jgi:hypothetical protein
VLINYSLADGRRAEAGWVGRRVYIDGLDCSLRSVPAPSGRLGKLDSACILGGLFCGPTQVTLLLGMFLGVMARDDIRVCLSFCEFSAWHYF